MLLLTDMLPYTLGRLHIFFSGDFSCLILLFNLSSQVFLGLPLRVVWLKKDMVLFASIGKNYCFKKILLSRP